MKRTLQKPLMLAYILFISICIVWHLVCKITGLNFETWDKIIVAVTVASYFFSLNSINKATLKQEEKNKELFSDEIVTLNKVKKVLTEEDDATILENINNLIERYTKRLPESTDEIINRTKRIFWVDVLGYLAFFVIVGIDGVYTLFSDFTDFITLLAFLVILIVDYVENTIMTKFEDNRQEIRNITKEVVDNIESSKNFNSTTQ